MTNELRYPIGMQTFSQIIEEGYAYVDKTAYLKPLLNQGKFIFLSRPRRFGKSLLLSTLKAYFEGRRDLFKGLAADSMDLDWTPSPVLRFDLNAEDFERVDAVELLIDGFLRRYEKEYGADDRDVTISQRFKTLIEGAFAKTGREVVILVDEYDKPLIEAEHDRKLFERHQRLLKSFFGNLKTMDRYIRLAFITGVSRFSKVSIFSDLNNLRDISIDDTYADICGWTEEELVGTFRTGIEGLARKRDEDFNTTLLALRNYYDGYLFAPAGSRLYNPYSVLNALDIKDIRPFWYETGTPSFLVRRIRKNGIAPMDINGIMAPVEDLISVGFDELDPVPLMFQTGYLTIEGYDRENQLYSLGFPNREVEIGFSKNLLRLYAPSAFRRGSVFDFYRFKDELVKGKINDFMNRLGTLLKDLPGEDQNESVYRAVTYLMVILCGTPAIAEHHGYRGRSDLEVFAGSFVYLFEFKYNKSVKEAMDQIHSRDYTGRYAMDGRTVYLIGANFEEKKEERGLAFEIEKYKQPAV